MTNTTETGHSKNVANFENLISFCTGYGADYNPSRDNLKLPVLTTLFSNARAALQAVKVTKTAFDNATNTREIGFEPLKKLSTRIGGALEAAGASEQTVNDAKTINRKIQGKRADSPLSSRRGAGGEVPPADPNAQAAEDHHISASQQGFDSMVDHFTKMIQLVSAEPLYNPNENDLKIPSLSALLANLQTSNTAAITATTDYSNARIARNLILYETGTGLVDIAKSVKKYAKSVFGASDPKYKQVRSLKFKSIRR